MRGYFVVLCGLLLCRGAAGQSNRYEIPKESVHVDPSFTRVNEETKKPEILIKVRFELKALAGAALSEDMQDMVVITEDGKEVKRIALARIRARDLTTMLVMDVSGSMARKSSSGKTKMQEAQAAARNFLQRLPARADSGLILFDHRIQPANVHPPSGDRERAQEQRRKLSDLIDRAQPDGGTAYLDATHQALVILAKHLSGDKAVILMTDGIDLNSKKTAAKVVEFANEVGIPVYVLGVGDPDWGEPVSSVLVLDHSGSMAAKAADDRKTKIEALHEAASRFVDLMREGAQATLLPFSSEVERPGPFSEDKAQLKKRILQLRPSGGTSLFDATYAGIETVVSTRPRGKRHVIVLTDGVDEDPGSRHGPDEVIELAKAEGVSLYMLGLGSKEDINEAVMRKMADATGGRYDRADNQEELFKIFERLSIDLHGDGIDEKALRDLAVKTGGRYYPVRDASQLELIYGEVVRDLEKTYEVEFPSLRQRMDARVSAIDIFVEDQEGKRVSDVAESDSSRGGVVVAEFNAAVYLIMLALLLGLLWAPSALRRVST